MPEPATLTAAAIGAAVLTEGIKFLYAQAGEVLKRWRERRDGASGDADSPEVIPVTAPAKVFDGDLRDLEIDLERVAPVEARLRDLRRNLGDYADGVDEVDAKDVSLLAKVDALRTLLETLSRQHITFQGEQRPPSGAPLVIGRVDVEGSIADRGDGRRLGGHRRRRGPRRGQGAADREGWQRHGREDGRHRPALLTAGVTAMEPARLIPRLPRPTADNIGRFSGRTWLLPQLLHWLEATTDRTFIVQGAPGAGKSMLIAWLSGAGPEPESHDARAQLEALRRRVAAAHFCVERSASVTPRGFAESVASQLTRSVASFAAALTTTLADRVTISGAVRADRIEAGATATGVYIERLELDDGHSAFDRAVRAPLQALYDGGHREPILILVDALDEGQAGSPSIGHLLAKLDDLPEPVRFLVTTRPDPRVLKHYRGITPVDLIEDAPDDENDVRRYVFERLPELEADRRDGVAARIATAAAGNFLYAHLVVEDVRRRLPAVPDPGALRLPSGLGALYHEFLNRELGADEDRWHRVFKPLLGLIAVAQGEGLSRDQLSRLVGGDLEAPLRICRQYLDGDLPEGPFRSFHKSFTDFLLWDRTNTDYHVDAAAMHTRIADDYLERFAGRWEECDDYGLRHVPDHVFVPVHLTKADTIDDARVVVLDVSFLRAKLAATDVYALVTDCTLAAASARCGVPWHCRRPPSPRTRACSPASCTGACCRAPTSTWRGCARTSLGRRRRPGCGR